MESTELGEVERRLIAEVARSLSIEPAELTQETHLASIGINSMILVRLFVFIEGAFNINLMEAGCSRADLQDIGSLAARIHAVRGS